MIVCLQDFQNDVDKAVKSDDLQFTAVLWGGEEYNDMGKYEKVAVEEELQFPYLDIQMFWKNKALTFEVFVKPNQKLKYLNMGSAHTPSCYKAITSGVIM